MKDNIQQRVLGMFLLISAVTMFVAGAAVYNVRRSIASADWVNHTHAVIIEANGVLSSLHAGDAALRGYVLTGDKRDQGAYRGAYSEMVEHLNVAKDLSRNEPSQNQKVVALEALISKRVDFSRAVVQSRDQEGLEGARKALVTDSSGELLDSIHRQVVRLNAEENALLSDRDHQSYIAAQTVRWTVATGVAVNLLLLALVGWLIRDDLAARRRAAAVLEEANAQLETKVRERTLELQKANQSLKEENLERRWSNQALTHQLRYADLIFNSIGDLIFVVSRALNISRANPSALRHTGKSAQELIGSPIACVLQLEAAGGVGSPVPNPIAAALQEGREIQDCPASLLRKTGAPIPVCFSLVPLRDQDKVVAGVVTLRAVHPHT